MVLNLKELNVQNPVAIQLLNKLETKTATIGVVGLGYVGLPLAVEKAKAGYKVIGFDIQEKRTEMVNQGINYIGDVVDEKQAFPALRTKQGKKRFLYPKEEVRQFLHEKGYLLPAFDVLDQVWLGGERAMVMKAALQKGEFQYTVQLESTFDIQKGVMESQLSKEGLEIESEN